MKIKLLYLFNRDGKYVVCLTICEYYQKLFETFGIESILVKSNCKLPPHYALIVHGDVSWYFIDPLKDLMNNQVGLKTSYFGFIPNSKTQDNSNLYPYTSSLTPEYIVEMDKELKLQFQTQNGYVIYTELNENGGYSLKRTKQ